jgi:hypothetical protein
MKREAERRKGRRLFTILMLAALLGMAAGASPRRAQAAVPDARWELVQNGPQPDRALHGMIFDPASDSLWSFGGVSADAQGNDFSNDVWRFDLGAADPRWTLVPIAGLKPPPSIFHSTVYDPLRKRMIVYGGLLDRRGGSRTPADGNNVWFLDLSTPENPSWSRQSVAGIAGDRFAHAATYVASADAMVVSGGSDSSDRPINSQYALMLGEASLSWLRLANAGFQARFGHALIHDAAGQRLLAYGGQVSSSGFTSTRNLDTLDLSAGLDGADRWTRLSTSNAGLSRAFMAHFFDAERGLWWIHGGQESSNGFSRRLSALDLSQPDPTWNETNLVQNGPLDRFAHAAAWDPERGIAWFQGGSPDNQRTYADFRALVFDFGATATPSSTVSSTATASLEASPTASQTPTPPDPTATPTGTLAISATTSPTPPDGTPTAPGETATLSPSATPSTATSATPTTPDRAAVPVYLPLLQRSFRLRIEPSATPPPTATENVSSTATPRAATEAAPALDIIGHYGGDAKRLTAGDAPGSSAGSLDRIYLAVGPRIEILDRAQLTLLGRSEPLAGIIEALAVDGTELYVGHREGLTVLEVADPTDVRTLAALDRAEAGPINGLALADGLLYASGGRSLAVFDRTVAAQTRRIATANVASSALTVEIEDERAYLGHSAGLTAFDISDPLVPAELGEIALERGAWGLAIEGDRAFVAADRAGFQTVDIGDPAAMSLKATLDLGGRPQRLVSDGSGRIHIANGFGGLAIVDVQDPDAPSLLSSLNTPGRGSDDIFIADGRAYLADLGGGLQTADITDPVAPALAEAHAVPGRMIDLSLSGELAITGQAFKDSRIIDLGDPTEPRLLSAFGDNPAERSLLVGDRLYLALSSAGIAIYNIADPAAPLLLSTLNTGGNAFDLALQGETLLVANLGDFVTIDVSDPTAPAILGRLVTPESALHVQQRNGLAYLSVSGGLWIIDTGDPAQPRLLNELGFDNQIGGLGLDGDRLYLLDGGGNLLIYDLGDATAPAEVGRQGLTSTAFAIEVKGQRAYVGNLFGLEVFDVGDPAQPTSLASFRLGGRIFGLGLSDDLICLAGDGGLYASRMVLP